MKFTSIATFFLAGAILQASAAPIPQLDVSSIIGAILPPGAINPADPPRLTDFNLDGTSATSAPGSGKGGIGSGLLGALTGGGSGLGGALKEGLSGVLGGITGAAAGNTGAAAGGAVGAGATGTSSPIENIAKGSLPAVAGAALKALPGLLTGGIFRE